MMPMSAATMMKELSSSSHHIGKNLESRQRFAVSLTTGSACRTSFTRDDGFFSVHVLRES